MDCCVVVTEKGWNCHYLFCKKTSVSPTIKITFFSRRRYRVTISAYSKIIGLKFRNFKVENQLSVSQFHILERSQFLNRPCASFHFLFQVKKVCRFVFLYDLVKFNLNWSCHCLDCTTYTKNSRFCCVVHRASSYDGGGMSICWGWRPEAMVSYGITWKRCGWFPLAPETGTRTIWGWPSCTPGLTVWSATMPQLICIGTATGTPPCPWVMTRPELVVYITCTLGKKDSK